MSAEPLRGLQFQDAAPDWRVMSMSGVGTWFDAPSAAAGAALVQEIVELSDRVAGAGLASDRKRPDIDLRSMGVQVWIPDDPGLTVADLELATAISAAARRRGLTADPSVPQELEWGIDTLDKSTLLPFWQTLLGYRDTEHDDLVDPLRRDPRVWFYPAAPRPLRNRIHFDVAVAREPALDRAAAVLTSGGLTDYAPDDGRPLLVDAEGNEVDFLPADRPGGGPGTSDWRLPFGGMVFYPTATPSRSAELARRVSAVTDDIGLPLMIDIRPDGVMIDTGKDQWEDGRFEETARRVQAIARELRLAADPSRLRFLQVCIDAVDVAAVRGFWRAALGYRNDPRDFVTDIVDPRRLNHPLIFQQMAADDTGRREQRNRIHLDLYLPADQVHARIEAALAAGGRITRAGGNTIADPEGNEVDIVTRMNTG